MLENNGENEELADALARHREAIQSNTEAANENTAATNEATEAEKSRAAEMSAAVSQAKDGLLKLAKGTMSGKTSLSTTKDASDTLSGAVRTVANKIPLVGETLSKLTGNINDVAKKFMDYNEDVYESWQSVAKAGAAATDGMSGLMRQSIAAGIDFRKYSEIIKDSGESITAFRGNLVDGAEEFAKITGQLTSSTDKILDRIGMTAEDMSKGAKQYIKLQTLQGNAQKMTTDQLAEGAKDYLLKLNELSKITGKNKEALAAEDEKRMMNDRFAAWAFMEAKKEGGQERVARAHQMLDATPEALKAGIQDMITSNGAPITKAGLQTRYQLGGEAMQGALQEVQNPSKEFDLDAYRQTLHEGLGKNLVNTAYQTKNAAEGALYNPGIDFAQANQAYNETAANVAGRTKELENQQRTANDQVTEDTTDAQRALRRKNVSDMERNNMALGLTAKYTNMLAQGMKSVDESVNELARVMKDLLGTPLAEDVGDWFADKGRTVVDTVQSVAGSVAGFGKGLVNRASHAMGGGDVYVSNEPVGTGTRGLLDRISVGEGTTDEAAQKHGFKSGYDVTLGYGAYGGATSKPISEMTIGEVKEYQHRMLADPKNRMNSSAVGKYQIVGDTLKELQRRYHISDDAKFDAAMQDKLGELLLKMRGLDKVKSGKMSDSQFQHNLSLEWASVADTNGLGHYGGQQAHTSTSQIQAAIASAKNDPSAPAQPTNKTPDSGVTTAQKDLTSVAGNPTTSANATPSTQTFSMGNAQPSMQESLSKFSTGFKSTDNLFGGAEAQQQISNAIASAPTSKVASTEPDYSMYGEAVPTMGETPKSGIDKLMEAPSKLASMRGNMDHIATMATPDLPSPNSVATASTVSPMAPQGDMTAPVAKLNEAPPAPQNPPVNAVNSTAQDATTETPETKSIDRIVSIMTDQINKLDTLLSLTKTESTNVDKIAKAMA
jgi:muramidase (phage lysozyme)